MIIHIEWKGPFSLDKSSELDTGRDYGVYQVYGYHPSYGPNSLLYIGQANQQTFCKRLTQEEWELEYRDFNFFVGRLADVKQPSDDVWRQRISLAERLLIFALSPAYNSSGLQSPLGKEFYDVHILNWRNFGSLLPEVSGNRFSTKFDDPPNYKVFELKL